MNIFEAKALSAKVLELFRDYRRVKLDKKGVPIALANITQAFKGILPADNVIKAVGNQPTPNSVSIAARTNIRIK